MISPAAIYLAAALLILPLPLLVRESNSMPVVVSLPLLFGSLPLSLASLSLGFMAKSCNLRGRLPAALAIAWCFGSAAAVLPVLPWLASHRLVVWEAALILAAALSLVGMGVMVFAALRGQLLPAAVILAGLVILSYLMAIGALNTYRALWTTESMGLVALVEGAKLFALATSLAATLIAGGTFAVRRP
jgi:hypothetical protein